MPKKKWFAIGFLGIFIFALLLVPYFYRGEISLSTPTRKSSFFVKIPVAEWTYSGVPCVQIEVGKQEFTAMLDLGFTRYVSLKQRCLDKIEDKTFVKTVTSHGFQGSSCAKPLYKAPVIYVGNLTLSPALMEEESERLQQEATIFKDEEGFVADGKLGWRLFKESVVFLDMKHDTLAVCDHVQTFETHQGPLGSFVKIPFSLEKELIEFLITTPRGPLHCFLDSGCTLNHLQMKNPHNLSPQEILSDESRLVQFDQFRMGRQTFGPIVFRPLPLDLPVRTQAVLGMDFLLDHQVLIDFKNRYIYFRSQAS